jgi:hypothetical protein
VGDDDQTARIVPCEIDGDIMYGGGKILLRGEQIGEWNGEPLYEWWPVRPQGVAE